MTRPDARPRQIVVPADRDLSIDAARIGSLLLVVLIHLLMIGASVGTSGVQLSRPLEAQPWFAAATWVGQIMPLFFLLGGFTGLRSWRSSRARGATAMAFVRGRVVRLARPALPFFAFWLVVLLAGRAAGIDAALLDAVASGAGTPIWFLAAFLLAQCVVPVFAALHARWRWQTLITLAVLAIGVDAIRLATGIEAIGWLNFAFVWWFVQQLGFVLLDGSTERLRAQPGGVWLLVAIAAAAYAALGASVAAGWDSADMLQNLNPPTISLVCLGIAQIALFEVLRPGLRSLMRLRPVQGVAYLIGARAMTVYLWHLPLIIAITGLGLLLPGGGPTPASPVWWATRPIVYVVVVAAVIALAVPLARFEQVPAGYASRKAGDVAVYIAALAAFGGAFWVTVDALGLVTAAAGTGALALAVVLVRGRRVTPPRSS
ncbi:acyltransferase family protein [Leucobacter japonicus]|uniref:acyltransferase family protein n=1 Tax=Leucobacter japonicus TaxID=1461259 RepID=UPI0006A79549|nr:acyltransferase [Leucobacter japonicus]